MGLLNSGFYEASFEVYEDSTISSLDSSALLKCINKPILQSTIKDIWGNVKLIPHDKLVVINFWSTSCKTCVKEMDSLNLLVKNFPRVDFIGITPDSTKAIKSFLKKKEFKYIIIPQSIELIKSKYNVSAYPTHFLIDRNGILKEIYVGEPTIYSAISKFIKNYSQ